MDNKIHKDKKDIIFRIVSIVILTVFLIGILFPLYWLVLTSFKDTAAAYKIPPDFSITIKDKYELVIDSSEHQEYTYEVFQKDSVMIIWMIYDSQKGTNLGDLQVDWVVDGNLQDKTEYS